MLFLRSLQHEVDYEELQGLQQESLLQRVSTEYHGTIIINNLAD